MGREPAVRPRRALVEDEPVGRRWWSTGFAALAISALGLAVAGSVALTTQAQTVNGADATKTTTTIGSTVVPASAPVGTAKSKSDASALKAFARRDQAAPATTQQSAALRSAIVREQAAQRAEQLAKAGEDQTKLANTATRQARQQDLTAEQEARQAVATKLAEEQLAAAIAARIAAAADRAAAQQQQEQTTTATDPSLTTIPTGGAAVAPITSAVIGARFGQWGMWSRYHTGLDFRAAYGTPIHAVLAGVVVYAGNSGDWAGNHVAIRHADGKTTMYSHMSSMAAHVGEVVQPGTVIGYVGSTGRAFGAHLHFELYPAGVKYGDVYKAVDPAPWLHALGVVTH